MLVHHYAECVLAVSSLLWNKCMKYYGCNAWVAFMFLNVECFLFSVKLHLKVAVLSHLKVEATGMDI